MRDRLTELGDATVVAITFTGDPERLAAHRRHVDLPFPLLADPDRVVYRQFDLGRGSLRQIWSVGTLTMYGSLLRRGRRLRRPNQDTRQLGGDFVIAPDRRLAAGFWPTSPDDRPAVDALIAAVEQSR